MSKEIKSKPEAPAAADSATQTPAAKKPAAKQTAASQAAARSKPNNKPAANQVDKAKDKPVVASTVVPGAGAAASKNQVNRP